MTLSETSDSLRDQRRDLAPQRRQRLQLLVESRRAVRLEELSAALGVSVATVRRDLDALNVVGSVRRVHGGAVAIEERPSELRFDLKATEAAEAKELIAAKAVQMIEPDSAIYLDSGSTVLALARLLHDWTELTVVTNSLPVANELLGRGPRLILIGGEVRNTSQAIVGPLTRLSLEHIHVDRAFMGTFGLSLHEGMTTTDPSEAYTKGLVLGRTREVVLLAHSDKMGIRSFVHVAGLERVDVLVTDQGMDDRTVKTLEGRGVRVVKA